MKRLLMILMLTVLAVGVQGQYTVYSRTIAVPTGTDTTYVDRYMSVGPWSIHYWYESLDEADGTLAVYGSNFPSDSTAYTLLWVDQDLDGANDLPKTLSDTSYVLWGESFPFDFVIHKFTKGSCTEGEINLDGNRIVR